MGLTSRMTGALTGGFVGGSSGAQYGAVSGVRGGGSTGALTGGGGGSSEARVVYSMSEAEYKAYLEAQAAAEKKEKERLANEALLKDLNKAAEQGRPITASMVGDLRASLGYFLNGTSANASRSQRDSSTVGNVKLDGTTTLASLLGTPAASNASIINNPVKTAALGTTMQTAPKAADPTPVKQNASDLLPSIHRSILNLTMRAVKRGNVLTRPTGK